VVVRVVLGFGGAVGAVRITLRASQHRRQRAAEQERGARSGGRCDGQEEGDALVALFLSFGQLPAQLIINVFASSWSVWRMSLSNKNWVSTPGTKGVPCGFCFRTLAFFLNRVGVEAVRKSQLFLGN
jgi:hypothetical protein